MAVVGYVRVSSEHQSIQGQRLTLLEYAQKKKIIVDEFVEIEISTRKSLEERKIVELIELLQTGDTLLVTELSRLGRNMLETLQIIQQFTDKGVEIIFVLQPDLSFAGPHKTLLLAIYSYFAETERAFLSMRTKQGLAAIKASGKHVGRPKGARNKNRHELELVKPKIEEYLKLGLTARGITALINQKRQNPFSLNAVRYFIQVEFKHSKFSKK